MRSTRYNYYTGMELTRDNRSRQLRRVLQEELTELQRYTLNAYYFERRTLRSIARERSVNVSTVSRTLHRAEEKVRRFMKSF